MTPATMERTVAVELSRDELRRAAEGLGREIYGIEPIEELLLMFSMGKLDDRPGAGHLHSLLEMAA